MGYDPFDYYDLGDIDQKGGVPTWFGSKSDLLALISEAHTYHLSVYADLVFNHNSGGDLEENPDDHVQRWTQFNPGSGKFSRNWKCFHPSPYETMDGLSFGDMPDLCHRNPDVYTGLLEYARWLLEEIDIDGFRYDFVKGYGAWMVRAIQELRGLKGQSGFNPFGVGECWDSDRTINDWLAEVNTWSDNPISAFDFPLRWRLQDLCMNAGFSLKTLNCGGTLLSDGFPDIAVTFVENHDVARNSPIVTDKMLAYSYILTHEGYPCVFWEDYYNYNLAMPGTLNGIDALVKAHENNAGGTTSVLYVDDYLYVMQRNGWEGQQGLIYVLNVANDWNGTSVQTKWINAKLQPIACWGTLDTNVPLEKHTNSTGWTDLWAAGRGFAVYAPI